MVQTPVAEAGQDELVVSTEGGEAAHQLGERS